ncbi:hypothetical protein FHS83_002203 [Rhizomicrobium palustre]|uniref:Pectate lyase superfamily protein domain-containing protein n=1 Tax=Rhizomicrobium palustre TaxID=189966 RepID=A0A846N070_9PROT|nr:right-handed parallel beta-helix repeat-containing protein [Rhizomicrobium palustre]NIK88885.1 hypothetical protein [Rhizomicrobium palustre]
MNRRQLLASTALLMAPRLMAASLPPLGAAQLWTSYQAEAMETTGAVLGPAYGPYRIENEAAHQTCVKLNKPGDYLRFTVNDRANTLLLRYCLPDAPDGGGLEDRLEVQVNGKKTAELALTSRFTWLYGDYPFSNNPKEAKPRHFFDDVVLRDIPLAKGDVVTLIKRGAASFCVVDFVDLELAPPPLPRPEEALALTDIPVEGGDYTRALRKLLADAARERKIAYIPPGDYTLTGDIEIPAHVTLQGAGMWHTRFNGDEELYPEPSRRLRFKLTGEKSRLCDFALIGKLIYRNDNEQNDGIFGAGGRDCVVSRLWIEHTKVGMWFYLCRGIRIEGCRLRNTFADGINLCVGTSDCVIEDCSARNTGDDCFAIWPAPSDQGFEAAGPVPGSNLIRRCTGELPFLAQGGAIYGGANNRIEDCLFRDIASGCGILISTTFPTSDAKQDNNFTGETIVGNCRLLRCGGYDHGWTWRGAFQVCLHHKDISGLRVRDLSIEDSFSDGLSIITAPDAKGRRLSDAVFTRVSIMGSAKAEAGHHDIYVAQGVTGAALFQQSELGHVENAAPGFALNRV